MLTSLPSHQGLQLYWLLPLLPSGPSCFSYSKENLSLLFLCHICPQHCQPSYTLSPQLSPDQETASFFCQGSESKYFRLGKLCGLCHNYPTLALSCTGGHRRHIDMWAHLCLNKTLFLKTGWTCPQAVICGPLIFLTVNIHVNQLGIFSNAALNSVYLEKCLRFLRAPR